LPLGSDFQNILEVFIFTNLPLLTNPNVVQTAVISNAIVPTAPTVPLAPTTPEASTAAPTTTTLVITPEVLLALQAASLNNFKDLGLRQDLTDIAQVFFANLPPVLRTPITQTV